MIVQQKYLLTLTISHIISALVVINETTYISLAFIYLYIILVAIKIIAGRKI